MAYKYFMAGTQLPVPPSAFTISIPSRNETVTLINDGDINILKKRGLKEFEFEMYLPQVKYPFADYAGGSLIPPLLYLQLLERLKADKLPFQLDIYRELPTGEQTWATNETVSLEDYTVTESADNGFDVAVNVKLKQYQYYSTQKVVLSDNGLTYSTIRDTNRKTNRVVACAEGDTLNAVLMREFGYVNNELINTILKINKKTLSVAGEGEFIITLHEGMLLKMTED